METSASTRSPNLTEFATRSIFHRVETKMARKRNYADRVNILKYIKAGSRWRFAKPVERNGKLVRDHVLIAGVDEHHPEGTYYIEWYEVGNRRRRQAVGHLATVIQEARRKAIQMAAIRAGILETPPTPVSNPANRLDVGTAIDNYLQFIEDNRSHDTHRAYNVTLNRYFRLSCKKTYVSDVERDDILKFIKYCNEQGLADRTVYDKVVVVLQMFKRYGKTKLIKPGDWPEYEEKSRSSYEPREIQAMLQNAEGDEEAFLKFMLGSGFRDREAQFVTWRDIDFRNSAARVAAKPARGFKPRNWEERSVPLPSTLVQQLQAVREHRKALPDDLIFPNAKGKPNRHTDMMVKRVAERAKLNCGQCVTKHGNKCSEGPYCKNYFLSKFRHTFAAEHVRNGVDVLTLQIWMGHQDIKSTTFYFEAVQPKDASVQVNEGTLAAYCA